MPLVSSTARDGEYGAPVWAVSMLAQLETSLLLSFCSLQEPAFHCSFVRAVPEGILVKCCLRLEAFVARSAVATTAGIAALLQVRRQVPLLSHITRLTDFPTVAKHSAVVWLSRYM